MARPRARWSVAWAVGLVLVLAGSSLAVSSFGAKVQVDGALQSSWLDGDPAIATTVKGDTNYLHTIYASDYAPDGTFVDDVVGPYLGVYYRRATLDGSGNPTNWTNPKRLNGQYHAERVTLATSGAYVYAAWAKQTKYWATPGGSTFDATKPRPVYFRANGAHGKGTAWGTPVRLSGKSERADYVWMAASGTDVYVTWTNADDNGSGSGNIRVAVSNDRGVNWTKSTVDTTTADDFVTTYVEGFSGLPAVAATNGGADVGLAWIDNASGKVSYRVSDDHGANWSSAGELEASGGLDNNGFPEAAATGDRIAFAWTTAAEAKLAVYNAGTDSLGPDRTIADCVDTILSQAYTGCEGPALALTGTDTIGVALSLCYGATVFPCDWNSTKDRESLIWYESTDNGANFASPVLVQKPGNAKNTYINDFASVTYQGGKAYVYWNGWTPSYAAGEYHDYLKVGS